MKLVDNKYIEKFGLPWCFREESPIMALKGKAFVINLDDMNQKGTHWTAARLFDDILYYADPFGTICNGWPPEELMAVGSKKIINRISFQRPSTTLCGYYAICFALAMDRIDRPLNQEEFEKLLYYSIV